MPDFVWNWLCIFFWLILSFLVCHLVSESSPFFPETVLAQSRNKFLDPTYLLIQLIWVGLVSGWFLLPILQTVPLHIILSPSVNNSHNLNGLSGCTRVYQIQLSMRNCFSNGLISVCKRCLRAGLRMNNGLPKLLRRRSSLLQVSPRVWQHAKTMEVMCFLKCIDNIRQAYHELDLILGAFTSEYKFIF